MNNEELLERINEDVDTLLAKVRTYIPEDIAFQLTLMTTSEEAPDVNTIVAGANLTPTLYKVFAHNYIAEWREDSERMRKQIDAYVEKHGVPKPGDIVMLSSMDEDDQDTIIEIDKLREENEP